MKQSRGVVLREGPRRKSSISFLPAHLLTLGAVLGLCFFSGCASYGPAPPVVVSAPTAEGTGSGQVAGHIAIAVVETRTPSDMNDVGTLFHQDGTYSELIPRDPVGPALDTILLRTLSEAGFAPEISRGTPSPDRPTLSLSIDTFNDRVRQSLVDAKQTVKISYTATLVLHEGRTTRTIIRKVERHFSPKPVVSFDPEKLPALMGDLFAKSLRKDLLPTLKTKTGASR